MRWFVFLLPFIAFFLGSEHVILMLKKQADVVKIHAVKDLAIV